MKVQQIIASCAVAALAAVAIGSVIGWAVLLILVAMIICGLMAVANELARTITGAFDHGQARRPAQGAKGQG